ncbi:MAG: hypothetical protein FWF88_07435 [Peptococcaceae bacterium]|nr:hypothetical protein [Peptococcaceae bacterium]
MLQWRKNLFQVGNRNGVASQRRALAPRLFVVVAAVALAGIRTKQAHPVAVEKMVRMADGKMSVWVEPGVVAPAEIEVVVPVPLELEVEAPVLLELGVVVLALTLVAGSYKSAWTWAVVPAAVLIVAQAAPSPTAALPDA